MHVSRWRMCICVIIRFIVAQVKKERCNVCDKSKRAASAEFFFWWEIGERNTISYYLTSPLRHLLLVAYGKTVWWESDYLACTCFPCTAPFLFPPRVWVRCKMCVPAYFFWMSLMHAIRQCKASSGDGWPKTHNLLSWWYIRWKWEYGEYAICEEKKIELEVTRTKDSFVRSRCLFGLGRNFKASWSKMKTVDLLLNSVK